MVINRDKYLNQLIHKKWSGMTKIVTGIRNDKQILDDLINIISSAVGSLTNPKKTVRHF